MTSEQATETSPFMDRDDSSRFDAVLLLAHGSTQDGRASSRLRRLARRLDEEHTGLRVAAAFWKEEPAPADALRWLGGQRTLVVPVLMGDGYFYRKAFPRLLDLDIHAAENTVMLGPLGESEVFIDALHEVVADALAHPLHDPPHEAPNQTKTVVVVGHGTNRSARSRDTVHRVAEGLRASFVGTEFATAFIDDEPRLGDVVRELRGACVIIPWFLTDGPHAVQDIAEAVSGAPGDQRVPGRREPRQLNQLSASLLPAIGETHALTSAIERIVRAAADAKAEPARITSGYRTRAVELIAEHTAETPLQLGSLRVARTAADDDTFSVELIPADASASGCPPRTDAPDSAPLTLSNLVNRIEAQLAEQKPVPRATDVTTSAGYCTESLTGEEVLDLVEYIYPSALLWAVQREAGEFDASPLPLSSAWWREVTGALPGRLARTARATTADRNAAWESTCLSTGCLRTPIFIETSKHNAPVADGPKIPMLCARPCHAFLANISTSIQTS